MTVTANHGMGVTIRILRLVILRVLSLRIPALEHLAVLWDTVTVSLGYVAIGVDIQLRWSYVHVRNLFPWHTYAIDSLHAK